VKPKNKAMGFELLHQQVLDAVRDNFFDEPDWVRGDSEIEKLFFAAMVYFNQYRGTEYDIITPPNAEAAARALADEDHVSVPTLILETQVQISSFRVDFVVNAYMWGTLRLGGEKVEGSKRWRKLVVECDGHEFHERTKEQAAKDRSRDRALSELGYDVFRFTGSEIWRDPFGCAEQVYQWALRGFC